MINKFIISLFGIGYIKKGGDLLAIFLSLVFGLWLIANHGAIYLIALMLFFSFYGIFGAEKYIRQTNEHNPEFIVIDEAIGIWMTILVSFSFLDVFSTPINISNFADYNTYSLIVFFMFYSLNLFKPGFIGQIEEEGDGGLSVIGDDLVTGFIAGIFVPILMAIYYSIKIII